MQTKNSLSAYCVSVIILITGAGLIWQATDGLNAFTSETARRLAIAAEQPLMPNFIIETMSGERRDLTSSDGKVILVEFIYTSCPTICQSAGSNLAKLQRKIINAQLQDHIQIYSVSFDPKNDTPDALKSYGERHGADGKIWTIARPSENDLTSILKAFGVIVISDNVGGFEHNAAIHIVNPAGKLTAIVDLDNISSALRQARRVM